MPVKYVEPDRFMTIRSQALEQGAVYKTAISLYWDVSSGCERPFELTLYSHGLTPGHKTRRVRLSNRRFYIDMDTPCRNCEPCLKARQRLWAARAVDEIKQSPRTWFCTFTVRPEDRVKFTILARRRYGDEDFPALAKTLGKAFTDYLKRVRKDNGRFRYLCVFEKHKDGFPHVHALIHEVVAPLTKRALESQWPYGFSKMKLCDTGDNKVAWYITKYLTKSKDARVRASLRYGQHHLIDSLTTGKREKLVTPTATAKGLHNGTSISSAPEKHPDANPEAP